MADLRRLEWQLQDVRILALFGPIERYRAKRKLALGTCNRFYGNSSSDGERDYVMRMKEKIQKVRYTGERAR